MTVIAELPAMNTNEPAEEVTSCHGGQYFDLLARQYRRNPKKLAGLLKLWVEHVANGECNDPQGCTRAQADRA
ncbi:hypothetical protein ABT095_15725 [Kitasatospora sp. NPDC002227]|uniref:hypothetical protein n=1 Tax=Kitasatospora sp. NPDC002227 TaxID=3154773 RepID=UPI00331C5593